MIGAGMDPIFDEMKKVLVCSSLSEVVSYVCGDGVVIEKKQPVHGGDANEADIAMTELFGGFDRRFYDAYFDNIDMVPGYEERRDLYNLYHLLNHLNLFGSAYLSAVYRIIKKYVTTS